MAEQTFRALRIYCVCGQKMKVAEEMLGRPGKCVACRQKIRIPNPEDFPRDTGEIYLKEHPEFLRSPASPKASDGGKAEGQQEQEETFTLGELEKTPIPLDTLESLRLLCSFEREVQRQLALVSGDGAESERPYLDKATLLSYRALVRNARAGLEDQLRQRLHSVTSQLTTVNEQLSRASLSLRIGDMDYPHFVRETRSLRHRREVLERRRTNLRGWLATNDVYIAGGPVAVKLEEVPCDGLEVTFPLEPKPGTALVDQTVQDLAEAFTFRAHAETDLRERNRMESDGSVGADAEAFRKEAEAQLARGRALVAFHRGRLEQHVQDCEGDIRAISSYLDLCRKRLAANEITESAFQAMEIELLRGQSDNTQAGLMAKRALNARSADELPQTKGTFLQRMAVNPEEQPDGIGLDSWLGWSSAGIMVLSLFAPMTTARVAGTMLLLRDRVVGLFLVAALLILVGAIPRQRWRGWIYAAVVPLLGLAASLYINERSYSLDPVGVALRSDFYWYVRPGLLLFHAAMVILSFAAVCSLWRSSYRWVGFAAVLAGVVLPLAVFTNLFGAFSPSLTAEMNEPEVVEDGIRYSVEFELINNGSRRLWINGGEPKTPVGVRFRVQQALEDGAWAQPVTPQQVRRGPDGEWATYRERIQPVIEMRAGEVVSLRYFLEPGNYRYEMASQRFEQLNMGREFSLAALTPPAEASAAPPEESAEGELVLAPPAEQLVEVGLRGVLTGEDKEPLFHVEVIPSVGFVDSKQIKIGETVHGDWKALEYSPSNKTLTISDGKRFLIFEPGESLLIAGEPVEPVTGEAPAP